MNKKLILLAMLACVLAFCLAFVSCGDDNSKLVGIWESEIISFEFLKNGTGSMGGENFTWTTENNNRLIISAGRTTLTYNYELSGKTLTLIQDGRTVILTKKK